MPGNWKSTNISKYIIIIVLVCSGTFVNGQNPSVENNTYSLNDSIVKIHSPHKATMYSALVPGLGQIYNKKYWKLPVIYGLTGAFIYAFDLNNDMYNKYKNAYAEMEAGNITIFEGYTDKAIMLRLKDGYQRNRDLNVIVLAAIYMLNIVDATVDAHLYEYKITEDVSLNVQPSLIKTSEYQNSYGLSLKFTF
ncbi:MAG: hypothetical protein KOO66_08440 [Bacteroidales bacterium]|nr:hypothetical protein [Bacteroidales bacterium]